MAENRGFSREEIERIVGGLWPKARGSAQFGAVCESIAAKLNFYLDPARQKRFNDEKKKLSAWPPNRCQRRIVFFDCMFAVPNPHSRHDDLFLSMVQAMRSSLASILDVDCGSRSALGLVTEFLKAVGLDKESDLRGATAESLEKRLLNTDFYLVEVPPESRPITATCDVKPAAFIATLATALKNIVAGK